MGGPVHLANRLYKALYFGHAPKRFPRLAFMPILPNAFKASVSSLPGRFSKQTAADAWGIKSRISHLLGSTSDWLHITVWKFAMTSSILPAKGTPWIAKCIAGIRIPPPVKFHPNSCCMRCLVWLSLTAVTLAPVQERLVATWVAYQTARLLFIAAKISL